jgi:hypothetical protein
MENQAMKKITYIAGTVLALSSMLALSSVNVFASGESISVSVDKPNAEVGDTVTVTVTAHSDQDIYGGRYSVYVNGTNIGDVDFDSSDPAKDISKSFTFSADAEGTYTVSLSEPVTLQMISEDASGIVEVPLTAATATVTATAPTTAAPETTTQAPAEPATEATTAAPTTAEPTTAAPATEEPATEATTEAPTTVAPATEATTAASATITGIDAVYAGGEKRAGDTVSGIELSVMAVYEDGTTQPVNGWSCDQVGQPLQEGDNIFTFKYEGFSTELTITALADANATVESSEETTVETSETEETTEEEETSETETAKIPYIQVSSPFGGDDLYLASDWSVSAPDGFEEDSITYAGYAVKVVKSENGIILAYMTDKEGNNGDFYIYDPDTEKFSYYTGIPVSGNTFYILSIPDNFDDTGLTKMSLSIDGKTLNAYQLSDSQAEGVVCLVYATDIEGNKGYYRFDTGLKTFVRYYADSVKEAETEPAEDTTVENSGDTVSRQVYDDLAKQYMNESWLKIYIIIALIVLAVILFIFVIVLAMKLRKIYNEYDFIDDDDDEDREETDEDIAETETVGTDEVPYEDDDFRVDLSGMEEDDQK